MNCKPGDIAIVVRSYFGNEGRLVEVLHESPGNYVATGETFEAAGKLWIKSHGDDTFCWVVRGLGAPLNCEKWPAQVRPFPDFALRPIRGEPETQDKQLEATT